MAGWLLKVLRQADGTATAVEMAGKLRYIAQYALLEHAGVRRMPLRLPHSGVELGSLGLAADWQRVGGVGVLRHRASPLASFVPFVGDHQLLPFVCAPALLLRRDFPRRQMRAPGLLCCVGRVCRAAAAVAPLPWPVIIVSVLAGPRWMWCASVPTRVGRSWV